MKRLLVLAGLSCGLSLALASGEEKKFVPVDLQSKFTHNLEDKFGNDDRQGNFLTVPNGEQTLSSRSGRA